MSRRRRIVVIGAGPGGLAAAMLLARFDVDVTVVERQRHPGGRTASIHADGYTFDTGPTFFLYPEPLREIFHACGFDLDREVDLIRLDPQYRLQFEDGTRLDATPDIGDMEEQIAAIAPDDARNFRAFMEDSRKKFLAFRPAFRRPFQGPADLLAPEIRRALPLLAPWRSVDDELKRYFADPRIRIAFSFQSKYLGMSPFRCPSLFTILSFLEYEYGVFHPRGGCGAVMTAMAKIADRMGVSIRLGEPVEEILLQGRRAVGVRTAAGTYEADAVVVNADFAQAMTTLVPDKATPQVERPTHCAGAVFVLDIHDVSRAGGAAGPRRRTIPFTSPTTTAEPRGDRGGTHAERKSVVVRAERVGH